VNQPECIAAFWQVPAFGRIEQNAAEHFVPAAVRRMREVIFERLQNAGART
jgi:hypothetical protein